MPIANQELWQSWVDKNTDPYGKACVDVARVAMDILDKEPGDFDAHSLICRADDESGAGGITGFMAGCSASMIYQCHSRGREFGRKWNKDWGADENADGVVNPALVTIETK